ncbi:esterase/lipase family protein [Candidatus Uabimicrobium sp. HlEnr_7]|uniref:esterase/lipase family protein n=1 Tax=Candidatus Uabimicrobium helgolandensis TaxID=3095367 RepID=UPI0035571487
MKCLFMFVMTISSLFATQYLNEVPIKINNNVMHWAKSEVYRDAHPKFVRERILDITRFENSSVLECFPQSLYNSEGADSSLMVLFSAPKWNKSQKTPVLLIHGAGDDAYRAWVHPLTKSTPSKIPLEEQGYMQQLVSKGYPVFAINFSHSHGCNYLQAEQIRNAVRIIKKKTQKPKVNIIAHSKGNCAATIYMSNFGEVDKAYKSFLSKYTNDIDTYVQIGAANKGIDLVFRYYLGNVYSIANNISSPICFYQGLVYGLWTDLYKLDIYSQNPGKYQGNYFPGQNQLLYNLVKDGLDFSAFSYTPGDFNMTMKACYYGGTTAFVSSYGIEHAIAEGQNTIYKINRHGIDPAINIINVYGTNSAINEIDLGVIKVPVGVQDYSSDGVVYKYSSSYTEGITKRGARLIGQRGFDKNHLRIAYDSEVLDWIVSLWY